MATIDIEVAGRRYNVACRDGEEGHFHALAAMVDQRAKDAATALGSLSETRQLLFAALLIADDMKELRAAAPAQATAPAPAPPPAASDPAVADALERLAARIEAFADGLEPAPASA
jgi:cell division protein ZapA